MMPKLINKTQNKTLFENASKAIGMKERMVGLIGKKDMNTQEALLIPKCNSIHTFLMNFPIDVIFLDKNLRVKKIKTNVVPNRILLPQLGARSVLEFKSGNSVLKSLEIGDELYVVD